MNVFDYSIRMNCAVVTAFALWPFLWLASISTYRLFFGAELSVTWRLRRRVLLSIVSFGLGATAIATTLSGLPRGLDLPTDDQFFRQLFEHPAEFMTLFAMVFGRGLCVVLGIAFVIKLYGKWIARRLSDEERMPGADGLRAWLSAWNVSVGVALALCAWRGFDYPLWTMLLLVAAMLLVYPAVTTLTDSQPLAAHNLATPSVAAENLSPERERVLKLLEQGKISAEEAAELFAALAATVAPPVATVSAEPWTAARKLSLVGAALVLLGFFLPWYSFNPSREVAKLTQDMNNQMQSMIENDMSISPMPIPNTELVSVVPKSNTVNVAGGDIQHGLGWIALILGLAAAGVPYVMTGLTRDARWKVSLAAAAVGAIVVVYLITAKPSYVSFGLPTVVVGFAIELFSLYRERHPAAAAAITATPVLA